MKKSLQLWAETIDVGETQEVTIWLNEKVVLNYRPGSRYSETAMDDAEQRIAQCLRSLLSVHFPRLLEIDPDRSDSRAGTH